MKTTTILGSSLVLALSSAFSLADPMGTAFTYQGRLNDGLTPANGSYELKLTLFDTNSGGIVVAGPITNSPVTVRNGLFAVQLDFGSVFNGSARWLEIGMRTNGDGAFRSLSPRQLLTPAPSALYAPNAGAASAATLATSASSALWSGLTGMPAD